MIDRSLVFQAFGVSENAEQEGYIQIDQRVQLYVLPDKVTVIFSGLQPDEATMRESLNLAGHWPRLHSFLTKSGWLAFSVCPDAGMKDPTSYAIQCVTALRKQFQ